MKTLLANETLTETSAKKRSPSLVAKLMGLDGLPSPQPTAKRTEKPFRHDPFDSKTTIEQQHFKDVYEDPEASPHVAKMRSTKLELGYIQERCDEMIRESIAIKTKLERVDSSPDLMLSFLRNERQYIHFASLCHEITVLKSSSASRYGSNGRLGYSCNGNNNYRRSSRYQLERKCATAISPTEIVVLKSNVAKIYSDNRFLHSADECRMKTELKNFRTEIRSLRRKSREARDIVRRVTSQMKTGFESGHVNVHDSGFMQYTSASTRCPRSNISESVVIKDAKKRMSHRWKDNKYRDMGMVGKSSTAEEMLFVSYGKTRAHCKTGYLTGPDGVSDEYGPYGWRDGYLKSTSRSGSLPPSHNQSQKTSDCYEAHADEKPMVYEKHIHRAKSEGVRGSFRNRDDSRSKTLQSGKRCHTSHHWNACSHEFDNILPTETYLNKVPAEQESLISNIHDATANAASVHDVCMLGDADSQEQESCDGSKEFDQYGQLSVLEVPSTDDLSSGSDCFERVNSKLHELRKQLHWLKSGTTYDSPKDEDTEQRSSSCTVSESENLESTYLTDLLKDTSFYDHDPYTFINKWYSVDQYSPIDPRLSDHFEKKHSQVSRPERRLLHDRLNEAIFLLSKTMVCFGQRGTRMTLTEIGFKDQLQKLVAKQEKEANEEFEDLCIDNDQDWFKPVSEIDAVGKEVAEVILDELVMEIVSRQ